MSYRSSPLCVAFAFLLSGCATLNAISLPEARGDTSRNPQISYGTCDVLSASASSTSLDAALPIVFDALASSFKSFIAKKASRFTQTFAAKATLSSFSPGQCLRLQRLTADSGASLFDVVIAIRSRGPHSIELTPIFLEVERFAASTSPVGGQNSATIAISAALSFVNGPPETSPTLISSFNIPIASTSYTIGSSPTDIAASQTSKLIPKTGNRAVNVAISVTEVGRGAGILGDALSGFDENAEALKSILGIED